MLFFAWPLLWHKGRWWIIEWKTKHTTIRTVPKSSLWSRHKLDTNDRSLSWTFNYFFKVGNQIFSLRLMNWRWKYRIIFILYGVYYPFFIYVWGSFLLLIVLLVMSLVGSRTGLTATYVPFKTQKESW